MAVLVLLLALAVGLGCDADNDDWGCLSDDDCPVGICLKGDGDISVSALEIWDIRMPNGMWSGDARGIWIPIPDTDLPDKEFEKSKSKYFTLLKMGFVHIDALWDAMAAGEDDAQAAAWEVTSDFLDYMRKKKKRKKAKTEEVAA